MTKEHNFGGLNYILFGFVLIALALGATFSIQLVRFGYWILILSVILLFQCIFHGLNITHNISRFIFGSIGMLLLILFFGIQNPQNSF